MPLADRIAEVNARIEAAARRGGRKVQEITLVGVSKTVGREAVEAAFKLGIHDFGENRVPDAEAKFDPLPYPPGSARLHLIGHLQTNKARRAVALVDIIHSVDSVKLAKAISRYAQELQKVMPVLLEVNVSGEESKEGLAPAELPAVLEELIRLPNLELRGLMTMAPYTATPEETRPVFASLRELFERESPGLDSWRDLSMGMTNDFEIAIEEGATLVRIGRAIFSPAEAAV
ncbi:MAG TPA: YggS family pyridoxal phosphate-dependent enzyme [Chloroflexia bacterium]|nr:YggS family pyridoxal phosphate-dependent enzyme [Chloroflexia bacterium]